MVFVQGKLGYDKETGAPKLFEDKNGETRSSFEVTAHQILFLTRLAEPDGGDSDDDGDLPI